MGQVFRARDTKRHRDVALIQNWLAARPQSKHQ
jgi:hypothetical protein